MIKRVRRIMSILLSLSILVTSLPVFAGSNISIGGDAGTDERTSSSDWSDENSNGEYKGEFISESSI